MPQLAYPPPSVANWMVQLSLSKRGAEFVGPCPLCGGTDRFHIRESADAKALVGCRGCIDGQDSETKARRFGELLRTVFPDWAGFNPTRQKTGYTAGRERSLSLRSFPEPSATSRDPITVVKRALAARLREAASPADNTPAHIYLARRWAWPPAAIGPALPLSVRWLARNATPPPVPELKWYGLPHGLSGAIVYAFHNVQSGELTAVSLDGLTDNGQRPDQAQTGPRWRRTFGVKGGAVFLAQDAQGGELTLCEGEPDALALAAIKQPSGTVLALGSTPSSSSVVDVVRAMGHGRPVVIEADTDLDLQKLAEGKQTQTGQQAANSTAAALRQAGYRVCIESSSKPYPPETKHDPNQDYGQDVAERTALLEYSNGLTREQAERAAWLTWWPQPDCRSSAI